MFRSQGIQVFDQVNNVLNNSEDWGQIPDPF